MSTTDRRICPFCQKPVATREQADTHELVLREHGGKSVRNTHPLAGMRGIPAMVKVGFCRGTGQPVPRLVEVFRARGISRYPERPPVRSYPERAENEAKSIVRDGRDPEAVWERFDIPSQQWITMGRVLPRE